MAANTPERLVDGCRLIEVALWEGLRDGISGLACVVVWDRAVDVMRDMCGADAVVQPVNQRRVWSIDGEEGPSHVCEVARTKMRLPQSTTVSIGVST